MDQNFGGQNKAPAKVCGFQFFLSFHAYMSAYYVFCYLSGRTLLIEEKCRFLSNFSLQTAEVELPGEFLLPKVWLFSCDCCKKLFVHICLIFDFGLVTA